MLSFSCLVLDKKFESTDNWTLCIRITSVLLVLLGLEFPHSLSSEFSFETKTCIYSHSSNEVPQTKKNWFRTSSAILRKTIIHSTRPFIPIIINQRKQYEKRKFKLGFKTFYNRKESGARLHTIPSTNIFCISISTLCLDCRIC